MRSVSPAKTWGESAEKEEERQSEKERREQETQREKFKTDTRLNTFKKKAETQSRHIEEE